MSDISPKNPVAYFCAEYGLEANLPLYAGGLGVLAGDTIKEAADQSFPMVAVGLLYRGEGAIQKIDEEGKQVEEDLKFDPLSVGFEQVLVDDAPLFVKIHLTEIDVWSQCWKKTIKNDVVLYLLDTETEQNQLTERSITHALYCGTEESLMKQQLILGVGGVKLLHALNIHPSIYHVNEGRPAFLHWQLIRSYMERQGMSYEDSRQKALQKTVYTNHTLVSAGNQSYNIHLLRSYAQYYADKMEITVDQLLEPGKEDSVDTFVMTRFALNVSHKANGVSEIHSKLSQEQWPEYNWVNVTNGVHMPTWQDLAVRVCDKTGTDLWAIHQQKKQELASYVQAKTGYGYDSNRLVVTWARRVADYKQLDSLFDDIDRLEKLVKNSERPIQLLVSGKAHVRDSKSKVIIQEAIHYFQNQLAGHALFIPNYNLDVAKMLVIGSDVWINIPQYGQEASGTSGMKAIANGVLQCTIKDGWAAEVDWLGTGWILDPTAISNSFYHYLEEEVAPLYYDRDEQGVPQEWLERMKKSIELSNQFSTVRMLDEYKSKLYS